MHQIYILKSLKSGQYYVGETSNIDQRMVFHNSMESNTNSTKSGIPWEIKYIIEVQDRNIALKIESHIKSMKSRVYIENMIKYHPSIANKLIAQYS
jgi:putative endonuclease